MKERENRRKMERNNTGLDNHKKKKATHEKKDKAIKCERKKERIMEKKNNSFLTNSTYTHHSHPNHETQARDVHTMEYI